MTASLRGLLACSALVLGLALGWVLGRPAPLPSPRLWSTAPADVSELRFARADQAAAEEVQLRRRDGVWWVERPRPGPARGDRVEDLLGALAAARWHRRGPAALAGAVQARVSLDGVELGVGQPLGEQRWLVLRGQALLVDGWLARLLLVGAQELRDREVFPQAARAHTVAVHGGPAPWQAAELLLDGRRTRAPEQRWLDPVRVASLRAALASLQLADARVAVDPAAAARWSIRLAGSPAGEQLLEAIGPCLGAPPATAVSSSRLGQGCIDDAALAELARAIDAVAAPDALDRRPLAAPAADVISFSVSPPFGPGGVIAERQGGTWRGRIWNGLVFEDLALEPAVVERALAELELPWHPQAQQAQVGGAELGATLRDGSQLQLTWGRAADGGVWVQRRGEAVRLLAPSGLELTPAAWALAVADLEVWTLEPTDLQALAVDGQLAQRGEVLGEWRDARGRPLPAEAAAALEALVAEVQTLRGLRRAPHRARAQHRLILTLTPPPARQDDEEPPSLGLELTLASGRCFGRRTRPSTVPPVSDPSAVLTTLDELELPLALCQRVEAVARGLRAP